MSTATVRMAVRVGAVMIVVMIAGVRISMWVIMMTLLPKNRILAYQEQL